MSIKRNRIWLFLVIPLVLLVIGVITLPILAAFNASYSFEPSSHYAQSDTKAMLKIVMNNDGSPHNTTAKWYDSQHNQLAICSGTCAISEEQYAPNGVLVSKTFFFYIAGEGRPSGTYTAVVYQPQASGFGVEELFRTDFTIGTIATITPGPTATFTPTPTPTRQPNGALDPSFGTGGKVISNFGSTSNSGNAVAIQNDGKIVVAGGGNDSSTDLNVFGLARYTGDGSLDTGFGSGGKVTTGFEKTSGFNNDAALAVALQGDGKIVAAGQNDQTLALVRYNSNGSLDTSFGSGGKVTNPNSGASYALAIQPNGKIVVAGPSTWNIYSAKFAITRYNTDGSLDTSFGTGGSVLTDFGGVEAQAKAIAFQPDGKIVVAGTTLKDTYGFIFDFAVARYTENGSLDTSFGTGGKVITDLGQQDNANSIAIQADGKILVGGHGYVLGEKSTLELARYTSSGSLDAGFGTGGLVITTSNGRSSIGNALVILKNGKIVMAGSCANDSLEYSDVALAIFKPDGSLDTYSGYSSGTVNTSSGEGRAVAVQGDGKILVAGSFDGNYLLWRYVLASITNIYIPVVIK